jgi:hypothetical protein
MVCYHVSQTPPISYVFSRAPATFMMNFTLPFNLWCLVNIMTRKLTHMID